MSEISCQNCEGVCCKGNRIIALTLGELSFMLRGGNKFVTVAPPVDFDREEVIYPTEVEYEDVKHKTFGWQLRKTFFAPEGLEYYPLAAGFGRYIRENDCTYLVTDENGWQKCGVYEDRPQACQDFEEAGANCRFMRLEAGIDTSEQATLDLIDMLNKANQDG